MQHLAIVADTSRVGCKADVAAAAIGIAAALEERVLSSIEQVVGGRASLTIVNVYGKIVAYAIKIKPLGS